MARDFTIRRRLILGTVVLLGAADVALAFYSWQLAAAPKAPGELLAQQAKKLKALEENVQNAQKIRDETPQTQKQCDQFEKSLFAASQGYSALTAEIKSIGKKAGVQMEDITLKQTLVEKRNIEEVSIEAAVAGDYKGVIQFLNGLQRADNFYIVDSLNLASQPSNQGPANAIKVSVHLKTFFRATP
jgi:Tfp pilus assembly protein PilO